MKLKVKKNVTEDIYWASFLPMFMLISGIIIIMVFFILPIGPDNSEQNRYEFFNYFLPFFILGLVIITLVCLILFFVGHFLNKNYIIFYDSKIVMLKNNDIKLEIRIEDVDNLIYYKQKWFQWPFMFTHPGTTLLVEHNDISGEKRSNTIYISSRVYNILVSELKYNVSLKYVRLKDFFR